MLLQSLEIPYFGIPNNVDHNNSHQNPQELDHIPSLVKHTTQEYNLNNHLSIIRCLNIEVKWKVDLHDNVQKWVQYFTNLLIEEPAKDFTN